MATFYLIRHGKIAAPQGVLYGRMPGVHLSDEGRAQAYAMAERFRGIAIDALYSSPLERARETAAPLAEVFALPVQISEGFSEVQYGDWSGRSFTDLKNDPQWLVYKTSRTTAQIPGGENILQLQNRFVQSMEDIRRSLPNGRIAIVSHQDPIKAAVAYYAGLHLDLFFKFEIGHASVTVVKMDEAGARVLTLNNVDMMSW
jgi:probable phosphoglycerate mutase